jgi:hypothetical protein
MAIIIGAPRREITRDMLLGLALPPCRICGERGEEHEIREHALLPDRGFMNRTAWRIICTFCGAWTEDTDNRRRARADWAEGKLNPPAYDEIPP